MRLHLTIQRNALPPVPILWTTDILGSPYAAAGRERTVSQLLEQVNEIVPLESGEWGLEDYTVEVRGYECLHFLEAGQLLKEDDEVRIRPLSTSDLRFRKISGRHQISADGKHLIDGVAFGRPLLRRADRPAIRIPPRKRRRITYADDEDDDADYGAQRQVTVHSGFEDDEGSMAGSDYNGAESIASEDEEDLRAELDDIQNDSESAAEDSAGHINGTVMLRKARATGLGLQTSSFLVDEHGIPYPQEYNNPLLDMAEDGEPVKEGPPPARRRRPAAGMKSRQKSRSKSIRKTHGDGSGGDLGTKGKSVRFKEAELTTPATIRLELSDDSGNDDDFEPIDDASSDTEHTADSEKENTRPGSQRFIKIDASFNESDSSSSSESQPEDSETSSSGSSGSSSDSSESEDQYWHGSGTPHQEDDAESTSSSGESSSSDSSSDSKDKQPQKKPSVSRKATLSPKSAIIPSGSKADLPEILQAPKAPIPPGCGQSATQKRNQRRRNQKKLQRLQNAGILPKNAGIADLRNLDTGRGDEIQEHVSEDGLPGHSEDADFEARRKVLLEVISSGGVDQEDSLQRKAGSPGAYVGEESQLSGPKEDLGDKRAAVEKSGSSASEKTLVGIRSTTQTAAVITTDLPSGDLRFTTAENSTSLDRIDQQAALTADIGGSTNQIPSPTQKPRAKLDKDSSRRLVFGALGLRTPKTKEDETRLREKLTKDADEARKPKMQLASPVITDSNPLPPEEDDSWKDKIELSAVECCYDGIELSTPPFPFVQRWDPQQRKGHLARNSGFSQNMKKRKRNNKHYEASFEPVEDDRAAKRQQLPSQGAETYFDDENDAMSTELQQDDAHRMSDDSLQAANDQLLRETEETYRETNGESQTLGDLPPLPEDLSTCAKLEREACHVGAVIAFQQLDMSSATNWQPRISEYRTALIEGLLDDGTLSLRIASRDRPGGKQQYDSETGERLYSKFEMPGYNEDEVEGYNGLLERAYAELIEPKLIKASENTPDSALVGRQASDAILNGNEIAEESKKQLPEKAEDSAHLPPRPVKDPSNSVTDAEVTEQVRKEINDLIKDAGWRSSVQSNGSVHPDEPVQESSVSFQERRGNEVLSPRFEGFSSSPPAEEYQEVEEQGTYPTIRRSSPRTVGIDGMIDDPDQTIIDSSERADSKAIHALREDFENELNQPFIASTPDEPYQKPISSVAPSETSHQRSTPPPTDSLKSTIPDSQPAKAIKTLGSKHTNGIDGNDSDSEFPSLESVFTSFSTQREAIKNEQFSSDDEEGTSVLQSVPPHKAKVNSQNNRSISTDFEKGNNRLPSSSAPASVPARGSKSSGLAKAKSAKAKTTRLNRYEAAPRSSQDWIGTQIVDLTLSSDPVAAAMEEEDGGSDYVDSGTSSDMPKGPGWVTKSRLGRTRAT
ncbi:MAG: hypothetical protein Q9170_005514 [Blastenia crenularia]